MKQAARKDFVEAFARGLEVIKAFDELHPVLGISEVAERANLARPTAHRFLLTLEELGYVRSTPAGYMLTPKIVDLGMAYISSTRYLQACTNHAWNKLARELDQTCSLTQLGWQRCCVCCSCYGSQNNSFGSNCWRKTARILAPQWAHVLLGRS